MNSSRVSTGSHGSRDAVMCVSDRLHENANIVVQQCSHSTDVQFWLNLMVDCIVTIDE